MSKGSHFVNYQYLCGLEKLAEGWTVGTRNGQGSLKAEELESALGLLGLLGLSRQDCGGLKRMQAEGLVALKGDNMAQV